MGKKRVLVTYGVDVDAVAGWLGSYGGEDSTSDISRGTLCSFSAVHRPGLTWPDRCLGGHGGNSTVVEVLRQV